MIQDVRKYFLRKNLIHMKKLLSFTAVCLSLASHAQTFYFPADGCKDSLSLLKSMPALAKQIIPFYKEKDRTTYFDNMLRMQMVAEDYKGALENLDSLRHQLIQSDPSMARAAGFAYQTFAEAKILQMKKQIPFDSAYAQTFPILFNALSEKDMAKATPAFQFDLKDMHDDLYKLLQNQKGKDSISLEEAR